MTNFRCEKCNFRFKREKMPNKCPYCGQDNAVCEEGDATVILKDVDSMTG